MLFLRYRIGAVDRRGGVGAARLGGPLGCAPPRRTVAEDEVHQRRVPKMPLDVRWVGGAVGGGEGEGEG